MTDTWNFRPSQWLYDDLMQFKASNPQFTEKKEIIEGFIQQLKTAALEKERSSPFSTSQVSNEDSGSRAADPAKAPLPLETSQQLRPPLTSTLQTAKTGKYDGAEQETICFNEKQKQQLAFLAAKAKIKFETQKRIQELKQETNRQQHWRPI